MKKHILLPLAALSLLSACSPAAETTTAPPQTVETVPSASVSVTSAPETIVSETSAAPETAPAEILAEILDNYKELVELKYTILRDENGEPYWLETDENDKYPAWASWYEIECDYTPEELKERVGRVLTGKLLENKLSQIDSGIRVENGKTYLLAAETGFPLPETMEIYPETAEVISESETSLELSADAWDRTYETRYTATVLLELDDGVWKYSDVSYKGIY